VRNHLHIAEPRNSRCTPRSIPPNVLSSFSMDAAVTTSRTDALSSSNSESFSLPLICSRVSTSLNLSVETKTPILQGTTRSDHTSRKRTEGGEIVHESKFYSMDMWWNLDSRRCFGTWLPPVVFVYWVHFLIDIYVILW
jgi:hypothetical protein